MTDKPEKKIFQPGEMIKNRRRQITQEQEVYAERVRARNQAIQTNGQAGDARAIYNGAERAAAARWENN